MRFTKKRLPLLFLLLIVGLFGAQASLFAQRGGRVSIDDRVKMLVDQLSLTKEQGEKVRAIYEASEKERMNIFQANQDDREARRAAMMKHAKAVDDSIDSLLTADQKTAFAKFRNERQGMMGGPRTLPPRAKTDNAEKQ